MLTRVKNRSVFRTLSSLYLKEFTDVASTALVGGRFYFQNLLITLSEKKKK